MAMVTEPERLELHQAMRGIIGPGAANTFMELVAPRDWDDVVRVHHLEAAINGLRTELREEMAGLKAELRIEFKQDLSNLRAELKEDISDVRVEIAQLRTEFTALLASELRNQTKWIVGVLTTLCVALIVSVL